MRGFSQSAILPAFIWERVSYTRALTNCSEKRSAGKIQLAYTRAIYLGHDLLPILDENRQSTI